jgi:hypothetical protein
MSIPYPNVSGSQGREVLLLHAIERNENMPEKTLTDKLEKLMPKNEIQRIIRKNLNYNKITRVGICLKLNNPTLPPIREVDVDLLVSYGL